MDEEEEISKEEIRKMIKQLKGEKAPGMDGITRYGSTREKNWRNGYGDTVIEFERGKGHRRIGEKE